jgi:tetratricopeptide (TPR) repeat protein
VFGGTHVRTLTAIDRYARILRDSGQFFESKELFEQCLQLRMLIQGENSASTKVTRAALSEVQTLLKLQIREQEREQHIIACTRRLRELENDAILALQAGDTFGALSILAAYHEISKDTFGLQSISAARAAASYGCILLKTKQFHKAQVLLREAILILRQDLGLCSMEVLVCESAFARALVGIGRFKNAEELLINCLDRYERSVGLHDYFYIKIVLQLCRLYSMTGSKLQTARALAQECLSYAFEYRQNLMVQSCSVDTQSEYLDILDDITHALLKFSDVETAETFLKQTMNHHIQHDGRSHIYTLEATLQLAKFFVKIQKPQQALPLLQFVLEMRSNKLGSFSHATLCAAEDLASAYEALCQVDLADLLLTLSVLQRRAAGTMAPSDLSAYLMQRALILQKAGKYESALCCFLECLEHQSSVNVTHDSIAFKAAEHAAFCMLKIGHLQQARMMYSHCLRALRDSSLDARLSLLTNFGIVAALQGNISEAETCFIACLSAHSSSDATEHADRNEYIDAAWNLAILSQKQENFSQAESLFMFCIQKYEQIKDVAKQMGAKHSLALLHW